MSIQPPDLSVIIPALNEETSLPTLLRNLFDQESVRFEIIIADGGSTDNTLVVVESLKQEASYPIHVTNTHPGRALQMNEAVKLANARDLLFLHADSVLYGRDLLRNALDTLYSERKKRQTDSIAAHFALKFIRTQDNNPFAYYFYEAKTHLNRVDCINGDQGFLLSKEFFYTLGEFDDSHPYMEDARLARRIFAMGCWITLNGTIGTSARRFEMEGLKQRQILNSFLCIFDAIGMREFFDVAAHAYRYQDHTTTLKLKPFLFIINKLLLNDGPLTALKNWYRTGAYISSNTWQLAFNLDCKRHYKKGLAPGDGPMATLNFYDKWLSRLSCSAPINALTAFLTIIWFYSLFLKSIMTE